MNNTALSKILIFSVGAAVGSAVTWKLLKTKYERIAQEEIESVKEVFSRRQPIEEPTDTEETEDTPEATVDVQSMYPETKVYEDILQKNGYKNYSEISKTEKKEVDDVEKPYVISPEEFDELDEYETSSLTYYEDGVLTDEEDNIIDDPDDIVGPDFENHFGEYEDDSVFIRNDRRRCDYEILRDYRRYSDKHPNLRPSEG